MNIRLWSLLAVLVLGLPLPATAQSWFTKSACTVTDPAIDPAVIDAELMARIEQSAKDIPNGVGRFWRVTSPEGAVSHLWGTLHTTDLPVLRLPPALERTISRARTVAMEIDPIFQNRIQLAEYNSGKDLYSAQPDPQRYEGLDSRVKVWVQLRLKSLGYSDDILQWFNPGPLTEIILSDPCNDFSYGTLLIQDSRIQMLGMLAGARVEGLEHVDAATKRFDADPALAMAILDFYGSLLQPSNVKGYRRSATALYLQGRLGAFMAWDRLEVDRFFGAEKGARVYDTAHGYLVDERNRNWMPRLEMLMNRGEALVAVGALHLPGETGLVALLRAAGFIVERVPVKGEVGFGD